MKSCIASHGSSLVLLLDAMQSIPVGVQLSLELFSIFRAIIDYDYFIRSEGLSKDWIERFGDILRSVVCRNYYTNGRGCRGVNSVCFYLSLCHVSLLRAHWIFLAVATKKPSRSAFISWKPAFRKSLLIPLMVWKDS